jgi:hypothetical protein
MTAQAARRNVMEDRLRPYASVPARPRDTPDSVVAVSCFNPEARGRLPVYVDYLICTPINADYVEGFANYL